MDSRVTAGHFPYRSNLQLSNCSPKCLQLLWPPREVAPLPGWLRLLNSPIFKKLYTGTVQIKHVDSLMGHTKWKPCQSHSCDFLEQISFSETFPWQHEMFPKCRQQLYKYRHIYQNVFVDKRDTKEKAMTNITITTSTTVVPKIHQKY